MRFRRVVPGCLERQVAGNEGRTRGFQIGKLTLYRWSHAPIQRHFQLAFPNKLKLTKRQGVRNQPERLAAELEFHFLHTSQPKPDSFSNLLFSLFDCLACCHIAEQIRKAHSTVVFGLFNHDCSNAASKSRTMLERSDTKRSATNQLRTKPQFAYTRSDAAGLSAKLTD